MYMFLQDEKLIQRAHLLNNPQPFMSHVLYAPRSTSTFGISEMDHQRSDNPLRRSTTGDPPAVAWHTGCGGRLRSHYTCLARLVNRSPRYATTWPMRSDGFVSKPPGAPTAQLSRWHLADQICQAKTRAGSV